MDGRKEAASLRMHPTRRSNHRAPIAECSGPSVLFPVLVSGASCFCMHRINKSIVEAHMI